MNFKILIILVILASSLFFLCRFFLTPPSYQKLTLGKSQLIVKIAQSEKEREKGLSGIRQFKENEGMLFILPEKQVPAFWMKGMFFPLDFIWINDKTVVDLTENVPMPSPNTKDENLILYQPNQPVDKVLEVSAGFVKKNGIQIGNLISY